jgi:hypothetical protein
MLKVLPIQTKEEQEAACLYCSATFLPEMLAYAAYVDEKLIGVCQFKLTGEGGEIHSLDAIEGNDSFQPLFVMGRATLSFIEICGGERGFFCAPVRDELLIGAIGFRKDEDGRYSVNLKGFFDHPCSHN